MVLDALLVSSSFGRERHATSRTLQQLEAEFLLKSCDTATHGRLSQAKVAGGGREALDGSDATKQAKGEQAVHELFREDALNDDKTE